MNTCILFYCCVIIIVLSGYGTSGLPYMTEDLYEGSQCKLTNGSAGVCKILTECEPILADVLAGRRHALSGGRCGFKMDMEIVCCPLKVTEKINVRPADEACQAYGNEVNSDTGVGLERGTPEENQQLSWHILGGSRAVAGEFPYMVALGVKNTDGEIEDPVVYNCGGALISSTFVLTAAHCVSNVNNLVPVVARVGSEDTHVAAPDTQEIRVARVIAHPDYRRSLYYHDIGLVQLVNPARMSNNVKPICLQTRALQESNVNSNTSFVVIGFGATEIGGDGTNQLMKTGNLNLVANSVCREDYENFPRLPDGLDDKVICARDFNTTRNSDACQGDSGGPLLMMNGKARMVLGVTSYGQTCGGTKPAVYTSVFSYLDWIESHVWPEQSKI